MGDSLEGIGRRKVGLGLAALIAAVAGCARPSGSAIASPASARQRPHRITLVVDAFDDHVMEGVEIYATEGAQEGMVFRSAVIRANGRASMGYVRRLMPDSIRVSWTKLDDPNYKRQINDPLAGNFTIPVASRIPDALYEELDRGGGELMFKIRLHPDGPLVGWDVVRRTPGGSRCEGSIGCCGCSPGEVLRDWKSPNPQSTRHRSSE